MPWHKALLKTARVGRMGRISFLLPAAFVLVSVTTAWLIVTIWLNTIGQTQVLSAAAYHDRNLRLSTRAVIVAAEALNTRLLGVMADVYSAPGSVTATEKIFDDLQAQWSALNKIDNAGHLVGRASDEFATILKAKAVMLDVLRSGGKDAIAKLYDDLLEPSVRLRRHLRGVLADIDSRNSENLLEVLSTSQHLERLTRTAGVLIIVVALLACLYVVFKVARPFAALTEDMNLIAANRLDVTVPYSSRADEIGDMARALELFKANAVERHHLEMQKKDAEIAWQEQRKRELNGLAENLESAVGDAIELVDSSAAELVAAVGSLTGTADETQRRSGTVKVASEQTSINIERIARSTEELLASAGEIRRHIDEASRITDEAATNARLSRARIDTLSSAGAQCNHRGRACRRGGKRVFGGRQRSQGAGSSGSERVAPHHRSCRRYEGRDTGFDRRYRQDRRHHRSHRRRRKTGQ